MANHDGAASRRYHEATNHSLVRLRTEPHSLDWDIQPLPFKIYPQLEPHPLPRELPPSPVAALTAIAGATTSGRPGIPDLQTLARVLHFSAGITRKKTYPGGHEHYFRAAACTGALYHIDLYVICGDLPDLAAGVYHFGPHDFALYELRAGDHRGVLVAATGNESSVAHAPAVLVCASTYWRNAWKYRARTYRHCFWDTGTIVANLLAVTAADALPARLVCGFVDDTVTALLGLDPLREGPVALVTLGEAATAVGPRPPVAPIAIETLPLSRHAVDYPTIREAHTASALLTPNDVRTWRDQAPLRPRQPASAADVIPLQPLTDTTLPTDTIDRVIVRRGSTRQFAPVPITFEQLSTILHSASRRLATDFGPSPNDLYLIVNAVEGLSPGSYVYDRERQGIELLRAGNFRREAGHLDLGQDLAADASLNIYLLCALDPLLGTLGNRGYRVAQLDAAISGGRAYLAAYALGLGATGLTFFDDDVTSFFSPHGAGKSVMFLVAIGKGVRPRRA